MLDSRLNAFWCDGLIPEHYLFDDAESRIVGIAWLGKTGQEPWEFTLFLQRG